MYTAGIFYFLIPYIIYIHIHLLFQSFHCCVSLCLSGACCPSGVRLFRMAGNNMRVSWRSSGSSHGDVAEVVESGGGSNYTCSVSPGGNSCDVYNIQCGDIYHVVVAPLTPEGGKGMFCPQRMYSGRPVETYSEVGWWGMYCISDWTYSQNSDLCCEEIFKKLDLQMCSSWNFPFYWLLFGIIT